MQRLSFLWAALALVLALLGTMAFCGDAAAAVRLCVELESDDNTDGLRKLLLGELGHHPTHQVVAADCQSMLHVELFGVAGARYLTARINREVPVRYTVKNAADLPERLGEAVRLVLGHDPVYLVEDHLGPGLGLMTMQINGWVDAEKAVGSALKVDAALSGRVGVRFLRQHNFDFDVFAIGYLPLTNAQDVDSPLPKAHTPSVQIGLGVGF